VEDVRTSLAEALAKADKTHMAGLKKILKAAVDKGFALGAVTGMEEGLMQQLADHLGLAEMNVTLLSYPQGRLAEPGVEAWLRMARTLNVKPTRCIALTTSGVACKTALKAHMKSVAIPDEFTSCEDFGGADIFVDSVGQLQADKLWRWWSRPGDYSASRSPRRQDHSCHGTSRERRRSSRGKRVP